MPIDPDTILHTLPKPGGREVVLLRRVVGRGAVRLEITVAHPVGRGQFYAVRSIGIGPDMLQAFAEAAPAAVRAVLAAGDTDRAVAVGGAPTASPETGEAR